MTMASGTWGTIPWSISDDGALTLGAGIQPTYTFLKTSYPWNDYRPYISSVAFTGAIAQSYSTMGNPSNETSWLYAFADCSALTSATGLSNISNAISAICMFDGCSSLTSIDLSGFDTSKIKDIRSMFGGCTVLASVKFGAYGFGSLDIDSASANLKLIDSNYKTAECNGIVVSSDKQFLALEKAEQAGTWTRNATASSISCTAQRTASGTAREDGDDVTFTFTWVFAEGATSAPVRIYQKAAGDPSYPSTPTSSLTLSGNAGNTAYTIAGIGDSAYDYRVEIVDGSSTYAFFPAVTANIRLMDFDANGNAHVYGGLTTDGGLAVSGTIEQGTGTTADSSDQVALGKYNVSDTNDEYALIIGNGTSDSARSNALTVDWDGNLDFGSVGDHYFIFPNTDTSGNPTVTHWRMAFTGYGNLRLDKSTDGGSTWTLGTRYFASEDRVWPLDKGGTGATTAAGARTALGLGSFATRSSLGIVVTAKDGSVKDSSARSAGANYEIDITLAAESGYMPLTVLAVTANSGQAFLRGFDLDGISTGSAPKVKTYWHANAAMSANTVTYTAQVMLIKTTLP